MDEAPFWHDHVPTAPAHAMDLPVHNPYGASPNSHQEGRLNGPAVATDPRIRELNMRQERLEKTRVRLHGVVDWILSTDKTGGATSPDFA